MIFVETPIFTKMIDQYLTDDEYRFLQIALIAHPEIGNVIPGSGGLRKMRWSGSGRGKRGGTRVIYYWAISDYEIMLLYIYPKNVQDDLTPQQLKLLRQIVEDKYNG